MSQPQALSSKEQSLFRQVVKNYESKQYKKGLKCAEQILKKSPKHGDTQAMKALLINSLGQRDEAFALGKEALKNGMKSHTCWHVYGLLWRSVRNTEEAIKAYKFALRLDPENVTIQRDLALMQVQMRDYQGYIQIRKQMVQARPGLRQNWTALAVAHHLAGDLDEAEHVLNTFEETLKNPPPKSDTEHSEATLYKTTIIAESGEVERALEHLESIKNANLDRTAVMEMRADYLLRLGKKEEAEKAYRDLLDRNNEYRAYYEGLEKALGLEQSDKQGRKELYNSFAQKYDRLDAARRIPLDFLEGEDFREAADQYLRRMLQKGVPSTFNNIKSLYSDINKRSTIQDLAEGYANTKQANGTAETSGDHKDRLTEAVLYFLAQHYNFRLTRNLDKAMQITKQLVESSPKKYDYVMMRARILKHQGNIAEAAKVMNDARELDSRDRYINTKCAKYQLRNHENDSALKTMSKFTKNDVVGGTLGDLHEMQSLWYITEDGEAYARQGKLGRALKRFDAVFNIFQTWEEDQFDFHSFSLRKGMIRAYIDMMRWEDHMRDHPFYQRVAIDAIKVYLLLADKPELGQGDCLSYDFAQLDDAGKKRELKRSKKESDKVEKEHVERREADKKVVGKKGNLGVDGEVKKTDDDPRGTNFLETKNPLSQASKYLEPLMQFGQTNLEAQHVGFEVYLRRNKLYLALKCLLTAEDIYPKHPTTHQQILRFRQALQQHSSAPDSALTDLATSSLPSPYSGFSTPITKLNDDFLSPDPKDAQRTFAHSKASYALDPSTLQSSINAISGSIDTCPDIELEDALNAIELLKQMQASRNDLSGFVEKASSKWPAAAALLKRERGFDEQEDA